MNEQELYEFAKMFDAAIASDNPAVKKALRNFMLIAAISESENAGETGPFQGMFDRLTKLENDVAVLRNSGGVYSGGYATPTWVAGTGIGYPGSYTVTSGGYSGRSSNTSSIDAIGSSTVTEQQIIDLLSDLKTDKYWNDDDVSSIEQAYKDANGK